jgi:hypothetical protein
VTSLPLANYCALHAFGVKPTGCTSFHSLFATMVMLGHDRTLARLQSTVEVLTTPEVATGAQSCGPSLAGVLSPRVNSGRLPKDIVSNVEEGEAEDCVHADQQRPFQPVTFPVQANDRGDDHGGDERNCLERSEDQIHWFRADEQA